jgi:hypothetical protein
MGKTPEKNINIWGNKTAKDEKQDKPVQKEQAAAKSKASKSKSRSKTRNQSRSK